MSERRPYIGGQAVIEGVMMRSPRSFAVVVRRRGGDLVVRERAMKGSRGSLPAPTGSSFAVWPFVRGVTAIVEAFKLGSEALRFSSDLYVTDLEAEEAREKGGSGPPAASSTGSSAGPSAGPLATLAWTLAALATGDGDPGRSSEPAERDPKKGGGGFPVVMIAFALLLFVALPQAVAGLVNRGAHLGLEVRSAGFQALTGGFKLLIVVGYLLLLRSMPEIRRVFQYHGAEHKTISTYEADEPLAVERAREKSTLHPRCGTTFLVLVALTSILVFSAAAPLLPKFAAAGLGAHVLLFLLKLPFLPVLASITFELQRLSARYCTTGPLRVLLWPGFLVQKITTIEPDDSQLEVALASLRATLWRESATGAAPAQTVERSFGSFAAFSADPGYQPVA